MKFQITALVLSFCIANGLSAVAAYKTQSPSEKCAYDSGKAFIAAQEGNNEGLDEFCAGMYNGKELKACKMARF